MTASVMILQIQLSDPAQEEQLFACWREAKVLLTERFRLSESELLVVERGHYLVLFGFPLPGVWGLISRDRNWQEIQAKCPEAHTHVVATRRWHSEAPCRDLTTAELERWLDERRDGRRDFVLVDALSEDSYARGHLPGALSLPSTRAKEAEVERVIGSEVGRTVVVYCSGYDCPASVQVALRLMELGYTDVWEYPGGLGEWAAGGGALESISQPAHP